MGKLEVLDAVQAAQKTFVSAEELGLLGKKDTVNGRTFTKFRKSIYNAYLIFSKHPKFYGKIRFDEFSQTLRYNGEAMEDRIIFDIMIWIEGNYYVEFEKNTLLAAFQKVAHENRYHAILEIVEQIPYNGEKNIDDFLWRYAGVNVVINTRQDMMKSGAEKLKIQHKQNSDRARLICAYSRKFFLSSMARMLWSKKKSPVKVDTVLCLFGEQGIGKSQMLKALCLSPEFFSSTPLDMASKDAILKIQGIQIYELAELAKRRGHNVEKAFIGDSHDNIVMKWEKFARKIPRQCIFAITTNQINFIRDSTGSRRHLPVYIAEDGEPLDIVSIRKIAPLLWAEAYHILTQEHEIEGKLYPVYEIIQDKMPGYEQFIWWLTDAEEILRKKDSELFQSVHPWKNKIETLGKDIAYSVDGKTSYEVVTDSRFSNIYEAIGLSYPNIKPSDKTTAEMILFELGFRRKRKRLKFKDVTHPDYHKDRIVAWVKELPKD